MFLGPTVVQPPANQAPHLYKVNSLDMAVNINSFFQILVSKISDYVFKMSSDVLRKSVAMVFVHALVLLLFDVHREKDTSCRTSPDTERVS